MKHENRLLRLKLRRLTAKLDAIVQKEGVTLDDEIASDIGQIMAEEEEAVHSAWFFPEDLLGATEGLFVKEWQRHERDALASIID